MNESELKGQKFLEYVANNEKRLRKNLKKNITYDEHIFDDIFQDSIIKVYNSIVKNNKDVVDYEQYFFTSSKFNYILKQNSEREKTKNRINIDDYFQNNDIEDEQYDYDEGETATKLDLISEIIRVEFGDEYCELYFDYMRLKVQGGMSYTKYSNQTGVPVSKISEIVSKIKHFTRNNDRINELANGLDI